MRATDFEYRHRTLLHLLVVGLAFLTYLFEPDDIVWALVRDHTTYRALLERLFFGSGALLMIVSALLQTWAVAEGGPGVTAFSTVDEPSRYGQHVFYAGRLLFALGLGLLAPLWGAVILFTGEIILTLRLLGMDYLGARVELPQHRGNMQGVSVRPFRNQWRRAVREEAAKWGLAITMVVFTLTLQDRIAEILAAVSFLIWIVLNFSDFVHERNGRT